MIQRVLYFTDVIIGKPDGPGVNEYEFTRTLTKRFGKGAWFVVPELHHSLDHLTVENTIHYSLPSLRHPLAYLKAVRQLFSQITSMVKDNAIDVIVIRLDDFPVVPWIIQKLTNIPLAIKTLSVTDAPLPPQGFIPKTVFYLSEGLKKSVIRNAFAIDTVSQIFATRISEINGAPHRIRAIGNATDPDLFSPGEELLSLLGKTEKPWPILGYVGGYPSERAAFQLVEIASRLEKDYPDVTVVVAGDDPQMTKVKQRAKELGVRERCHFLGVRPYAEMPGIINLLDIGFSLPIFKSEHHLKTGFSAQKVSQYVACGKPVISIPLNHEFIQTHDLGALVDAENLDEITEQTRIWVERSRNEGQALNTRIRQYGITHLSTLSALEKRIEFWQERLG